MGCYCMGPQNGEPLCPCRMKAAESDCKPDVIGMKRELDRVRDFFQKNMKRTEVEEALDKAVEACRLSDH